MAEREGGLSAAERAGERAAKNTTVRAAGEIVGKLATFVLFAVLARTLGQADFGVFVFALAFLGMAMIPIALGCDSYFLRRVSKDRSSIDELFFNILALKLSLAVPVLALTFLAMNLLGYDDQTRATVYVLSAGLLLDLLAKTFHGVFTATERSELLAATLVVQRVATAALGLAALAAGYGVVTVAATYSIGAVFHLLLSAVFLARATGLPRWSVARQSWPGLAGAGLPYAVQDVFTVLLFKLDIVILSLMATEAAVGRYGAAYRLLESTLFVTWALNGAFVAMYAYLGRDTEPTIQAVFQRSVKLALAVLVPCAVAFGVMAEPISRLVFGAEFEAAAGALRLLSPVVVLLCVITLCTSLIVSRRNPREMVRITASMVAVNVGLNVLLIPRYADEGAAAAMLVTELLFVAVVLATAARTVGGLRWTSMAAAPLIAGAAMAIPMVLLIDSVAPALVAGLVVYAGGLILLERLISPSDLRFVGDMVKRRLRLAG